MSRHVSRGGPYPVPASLAVTLLQEVANTGTPAEQVLAAIRCPHSLAELRDGRVTGLSRLLFTALYRECIALLEDHASRQGDYPPMCKAEVDMLCHCVITCRTLGEAIARAAAFCDMLGGRAGQLRLDTAPDGSARFVMHTFRRRATTSALLSDLTGLATYHRLFSWLIGDAIALEDVGVCYPPLLSPQTVYDLLHHSVSFEAGSNRLCFPAHYLSRPVVRTPHELNAMLTYFPFDIVFDSVGGQTLADTVHHLCKARLLKGEPLPSLTELAGLLNLSCATLRRRLEEQHTSLNQLRERCRQSLAQEWLRDPGLTLEDISDRLGFSQPSAFRRAFRAWTGTTPAAWRRTGQSLPQGYP